ncbi:hypothetical protein SGLAM104S_01585 [Streptomyces glaucescens]
MPGRQNAPRSAIIAMLRDGHSNKRIAAELHVDKTRVRRIREELGLPQFVRTEETRTIEDKWRLYAHPLDGGHMEWVGERSTNSNLPLVSFKERHYSAAAVAFRIRTGRHPDGQALADCGMKHCVAPEHVEDRAGRRRNREQLRYLQGGGPLPKECIRGHDQSEHGRIATDGRSYCDTCKRTRTKPEEGAA